MVPRVVKEPSPSTNIKFITPPARPRAEIAYSLWPKTPVAVISPIENARTRSYSSRRDCLQPVHDRRAPPPSTRVRTCSEDVVRAVRERNIIFDPSLGALEDANPIFVRQPSPES